MRDIVHAHFNGHAAQFLRAGTEVVVDEPAPLPHTSRDALLQGVPKLAPGLAAVHLFESVGPPSAPADDVVLPPHSMPIRLSAAERQEMDVDEAALYRSPAPVEADDRDRVALAQQQRRARTRQFHPDLPAYYLPFTKVVGAAAAAEANPPQGRRATQHRGWGIVLLTGGLEAVAWDLFQRGVPAEIAMQIAGAYLLGHEYGHFLVDAALAEDDWLRSKPATTAREHHDRGLCREEEAWCEAYALRQVDLAARGLGADQDAIGTSVRERITDGLPGYRDGVNIEDLHQAFADLLKQAGAKDPARAAMLADIDNLYVDRQGAIGTAGVDVTLGVSPGSRYEAGEWSIPHDLGGSYWWP